VDRLVYIDCDTLVLEDITPLAELELAEFPLWAVRDYNGRLGVPEAGIRNPQDFGLRADDNYFNTGVLVFRLSAWRRERLGEKCRILGRRNPELCYLADQNLINVLLHGRIGELEAGWNYQMPMATVVSGMFSGNATMGASKPRIVHFTSDRKPWLVSFDLPLQKLYADHVARTGWPMPEVLRAFAPQA
jgi:lipopolysaccharide biosynthesis glycosyltransferase